MFVFIPFRLATLTSLPTLKVLTIVTFGMPAVFHSSNARPRGDSLGSISFFIAVVLPQRYKKTASQKLLKRKLIPRANPATEASFLGVGFQFGAFGVGIHLFFHKVVGQDVEIQGVVFV